MIKEQQGKSFNRGVSDANIDLLRGRLIIKTYGRPFPWYLKWADLLKSKFGIELDAVSGCIVSEELSDYVAGYNGIAEEHIKKTFGEQVLEETIHQAEAEFEAMRETPAQSSSVAHNENPEITVLMDEFGWVTCPHCKRRFATYSTSSWDGRAHLSCGQKLRLQRA